MATPDKHGQDGTLHIEGAQDIERDNAAPPPNNVDGPQETDDAVTAIKTKSGRDKAAQFLKQADHAVIVTPEDNARVLRLIDWRILPLLLITYCLQSLDKTTLSYASVFGIIKDTNLVGNQFSWLGSVVYCAQLVFQPLVAYMLVRFPIGKFFSTMVLCWGAVLCCMAAAHNFGGLMATRLLLGAFEASVGKFSSKCSPFRYISNSLG